jgi:hypothetical protein
MFGASVARELFKGVRGLSGVSTALYPHYNKTFLFPLKFYCQGGKTATNNPLNPLIPLFWYHGMGWARRPPSIILRSGARRRGVSVCRPIHRPVDLPFGQPANPPVRQSTSPPIYRPGQSANRPIGQSTVKNLIARSTRWHLRHLRHLLPR